MNSDIKAYIEKYQKLLPLNNSISFTEAEKRASMFLDVMATITEWRHALSEGKIKSLSVQNAVYAEELGKCTGSTITGNKVIVEASEAYTAAREEFEMTENDLSYLKAYFDIFNNAHIFYRNMAKGENV